MKLYADLPARRAGQVVGDLLALGWVTLWVVLGRWLHGLVQGLQTPADHLTDAGTSFTRSMSGAAGQLGQLPGLGDSLRSPFDSAAQSGDQLAQAGRDLHTSAGALALTLGLVVAVVPILLVVGPWLLLRVRFVQRASAAQRFVDADADLDLFALRALSRQPMHRLAALSDDPAGAWRRRDVDTVWRLALLELRSCGLRPPGTGRDRAGRPE